MLGCQVLRNFGLAYGLQNSKVRALAPVICKNYIPDKKRKTKSCLWCKYCIPMAPCGSGMMIKTVGCGKFKQIENIRRL